MNVTSEDQVGYVEYSVYVKDSQKRVVITSVSHRQANCTDSTSLKFAFTPNTEKDGGETADHNLINFCSLSSDTSVVLAQKDQPLH